MGLHLIVSGLFVSKHQLHTSIQIQPIKTQGAVDASLLQINAISC